MENNLEDWYGMKAMGEHMRLEALFPVAPGGGGTDHGQVPPLAILEQS